DVVDLDPAVGQLDRIRERIGAVRRAEHGAAAREQLRHRGLGEIEVLLFVEPLEAVADADHVPAVGAARREGCGPDHRVEPGAVAGAGEDPDTSSHRAQYSRSGPRPKPSVTMVTLGVTPSL